VQQNDGIVAQGVLNDESPTIIKLESCSRDAPRLVRANICTTLSKNIFDGVFFFFVNGK